ncbi:MAG: LysM peptidoglycan-binding domain-containing protein [Ferruginibacter sp.]|nr:LysM peptidoglycan-binding domain-containing protein [Cytophagales bacterium]
MRFSKSALISAAVVFIGQLVFSGPARAQTDTTAVSPSEEIVIASDTVPDEVAAKPLAALALDTAFVPLISEELIADRLDCLQNEVSLEYNRTIQGFIQFFVVRRRDYVPMVLGRTDLYFPIFEYYLKKYNLPQELKYLSVVESGLNPRAISKAKAAGLWQFMPGTGRDFRLYQDAYVDERLDPYKSTEAACKYLKQLYNLFGDWELALASYNCGPGNVRRAIRRSGNRTNFWEIYNYLPRETRSYVPQFVALTYVLNYAEDYRLRPTTVERTIAFDTIQVSQHLNLEALSKQLQTPLSDLQQLNPHLKRNLVPAYLKNYPVRVPSDRYAFLTANRVAILDSVSKTTGAEAPFIVANYDTDNADARRTRQRLAHTVRRGESLGRIADRYHVSLSKLKTWNHLRSNTVRSGQRLTIWVEKTVPRKKIALRETPRTVDPLAGTSPADSSVTSATVRAADGKATTAEVAPATGVAQAKQVRHTVRKGEALSKIADQYGVGLSQIKKWNRLKSSQVRIGQKLTIWLTPPPIVQADQPEAPTTAGQPDATGAAQPDADQTERVSQVTPSTSQNSVHTVVSGESLYRIANQYGVKAEQIREWNRLGSDQVRIGQRLAIRAGEAAGGNGAEASTATGADHHQAAGEPTAQIATSRKKNNVPDESERSQTKASFKYHVVQRGDSLWSIARQYGNISVEKLKKLNNLRENEVKVGQKLIVG